MANNQNTNRIPQEIEMEIATIWKDMNELIPLMRAAVNKGLEKDFKANIHDDAHIQTELQFLNKPLNFLQKKWTMDLIYIIRIKGNPYFNDIRRAIPGLNSRTLTTRLKEFEKQHIVTRTVSNTQPIRVTYELTDLGRGVYELLLPLLFFFVGQQYKLDLEESKKLGYFKKRYYP